MFLGWGWGWGGKNEKKKKKSLRSYRTTSLPIWLCRSAKNLCYTSSLAQMKALTGKVLNSVSNVILD